MLRTILYPIRSLVLRQWAIPASVGHTIAFMKRVMAKPCFAESATRPLLAIYSWSRVVLTAYWAEGACTVGMIAATGGWIADGARPRLENGLLTGLYILIQEGKAMVSHCVLCSETYTVLSTKPPWPRRRSRGWSPTGTAKPAKRRADRTAAVSSTVLRCKLRPRKLAGNPDSPQVVIFLTSIIDVIRGC